MRSIKIYKINLINFKGVRNQEIIFEDETTIFGDNGTGKTTIFDAFTWMLFGKDSNDRKDFEVKTLDKFNKVIPKIEHEVSASISVDGEVITIKRILKENWVKKRGSEVSEFSGNVTEYYWNDVPMQQKEFQSKVSVILDESVFKLITNPLAFNSLKWQDRREALMAIAGDISDSELAAGNSEYEKLLVQLGKDKSLEDYKKQILASIKKAKEDLKNIPTRMDEISRSKPEEFDFLKLAVQLEATENKVKKIENDIVDKSSAYDEMLTIINAKKLKVNSLKSDIEIIESNARRDVENNLKPDTSALETAKRNLESKKGDLATSESGLSSLKSKVISLQSQIEGVDTKLVNLRNEWGVENAKELTFNDDDFHCPTCKREFEAGDLDSKKTLMVEGFKNRKSNSLNEINTRGGNLKNEKESLETELQTIKIRITTGETHVSDLKNEVEKYQVSVSAEETKLNPNEATDKEAMILTALSNNKDYHSKQSELETLKSTIEEVPTVDVSELQAKKQELQVEINQIKIKLQNESQIKLVDARLQVLEQEEKNLAQQIANVEKQQFVIENFSKLKIDTLEKKINSLFKFVSFKMFDEQINGGLAETCEALIDGVPFSNVNTASKINAGLDIINTLCEFYNVTAPIFIDNRESIVKLIPTNSQIVNLVVWEGSSLNVGNPKVRGEIIQVNNLETA